MSIPADANLYNRIKMEVKKSVQRWPSAYASGQLVQKYKKAFEKKHGPKKLAYTSKKIKLTSLERWFKETWVNLCKEKKNGQYASCGTRKGKTYPYCRPMKRIDKSTPMTVYELINKYGKAKLKEQCKAKQKYKTKIMKKV